MYKFILSIQEKLPTDEFHMGFYWFLESFGDWLWLLDNSVMYGDEWTLEDDTKEFFNCLGK